MRLLFIHGAEKLKEDKYGNFYTDGSYSQEVWDRYLSIFGDLTVIFRKDSIIYEPEYAKQKFQFFDKNRIGFVKIPDMTFSVKAFTSPEKRQNIRDIIERAILDHDCLIVRLPSSDGYIAIEYAKKYNKPYLIEAVGCPWGVLWNHSYKGKMLAFHRYFAMKKSLKNAQYVIYVTNEFLQHRYPTRGRSIACSDVVLPSLNEYVLVKRLNKIKNMVENTPIILGTAAAVNVRYKGQEYVIEAIARLNKQGYNFEYHIVGSGDNSYLKSVINKYKVGDKVKLLGSISHDDIFKYLDNIDIYIQPSKQEGLPRALIEAMSRGCPVLGSNAGGIPELLNREFIFNIGSVNEICKLLKSINGKTMLKEAKRSFDKALQYNKDSLDERRISFLKEFAEVVKS